MSPQPLPRYTTDNTWPQKLNQILAATGETTVPKTVARATLAGDTRRLRGIPVQARGVGGTSPGTNPLAETLRNNR